MTHEHIKALDKLIAAVENGQFTYHDVHNTWPSDVWPSMEFAYEGSLDAAKALHEALLPKHGYEVSGFADGGPFYASVWPTGHRLEKQILQRSINPARAWLIAILKAYRSTLYT